MSFVKFLRAFAALLTLMAFSVVAVNGALATSGQTAVGAVSTTPHQNIGAGAHNGIKPQPDLYAYTYVHLTGDTWRGVRFRHRLLRMYLGVTLKPVHSIGVCISNSAGAFTCRVHHTAALAVYASRHRGHLNVDMMIYDGSTYKFRWSVARSFVYNAPSAYLGLIRFRLVHHVIYGGRGKGAIQPDILPKSEGGNSFSWVSLAKAESSAFETTTYEMSQSKSTNAEIGYGIQKWAWTLSGGFSAGDTQGSGGTFNVSGPSQARLYKRIVKVQQQRDCVEGFMANYPYEDCTLKNVANWDSAVHSFNGLYVSCAAAPNAEWFFAPYDKPASETKWHGASFASNLYVSGYGGWMNTSTSYASNDKQIFTFHWAGLRSGAGFCLGGPGSSTWQNGSYVRVSFQSAAAAAKLSRAQRKAEGLPLTTGK